jgi:hypothetical protein
MTVGTRHTSAEETAPMSENDTHEETELTADEARALAQRWAYNEAGGWPS